MVVCLSSDVHPEIREYERTSTTAINAALIPVVNNYMDRLEQHLSAYSDRLLIMQSNGGIMTAQSARRRPISMIESGPAAGVLAAARLAVEAGAAQALSFDMGGMYRVTVDMRQYFADSHTLVLEALRENYPCQRP